MNRSLFTGTWQYIRLFLRRDRILMVLWLLLPALISIGAAMSTAGYEDIGLFVEELTNDPLVSSILGPGMAASAGGVTAWRSTGQIVLIFGIAIMLTVIRHTRSEEEAGRSELLRAYVTGAYASLAAVLIITSVLSVLAGLLTAFSLIALGEAVAGSLLYGLTISITGCIHAGIAAIAVQLFAAYGKTLGLVMGFAGFEIFFLVINSSLGAYSPWRWLSPMAWSRLTMPYYGDKVWPLPVLLVCFLALAALAFALLKRRDLGAGVFKDRPGRSRAPNNLRSPFALMWRLSRGSFFGALAAMILFGFAIGGIARGVGETQGIGDLLGSLGGTDWIGKVGRSNAFAAIFVYIFSLCMAIYGMISVARLQKEESSYHAELILTKPVKRAGYMMGNLLVSMMNIAALMLVLGLSMGITFSLGGGGFADVFIMCAAKIPAVWVLMGLSALIYGIRPSLTTVVSIAAWAVCAVIEFLWEGQVVGWAVMRLTPFAYAHYITPVRELTIIPSLVLTIIAAALMAAGVGLFSRRNVGQV